MREKLLRSISKVCAQVSYLPLNFHQNEIDYLRKVLQIWTFVSCLPHDVKSCVKAAKCMFERLGFNVLSTHCGSSSFMGFDSLGR